MKTNKKRTKNVKPKRAKGRKCANKGPTKQCQLEIDNDKSAGNRCVNKGPTKECQLEFPILEGEGLGDGKTKKVRYTYTGSPSHPYPYENDFIKLNLHNIGIPKATSTPVTYPPKITKIPLTEKTLSPIDLNPPKETVLPSTSGSKPSTSGYKDPFTSWDQVPINTLDVKVNSNYAKHGPYHFNKPTYTIWEKIKDFFKGKKTIKKISAFPMNSNFMKTPFRENFYKGMKKIL
jgi:hypothetical protein